MKLTALDLVGRSPDEAGRVSYDGFVRLSRKFFGQIEKIFIRVKRGDGPVWVPPSVTDRHT
jgi:hypothetical protein